MSKTYFRSNTHQGRFLNALQQYHKIELDGSIDREYGAAFYILSSDQHTWAISQDYIDRHGIRFDEMVKEVDLSHGYLLLVQLAANLFGGQQELPSGELAPFTVSPRDLIDVLDEQNFAVALTAVKLRRSGANIKDVQP